MITYRYCGGKFILIINTKLKKYVPINQAKNNTILSGDNALE